jgi:hypothetical protein
MTQVYELLLALLFSLSFIIILESCGDLILKLVGLLLRNSYTEKENSEALKSSYKSSTILRILTGMLILGMLYFVLGLFSQFHKETLILAAVIFPIFKYVFILGEYIIKSVKGVKAESKLSPNTSSFDRIKDCLVKQKWLLSGLGLFYILSFPAAFRPIIQFDAIWYHLTIPKLFLQAGNIDYNGEFVRYSVHPYLNFFWNSFFLSTPLSPAVQGLAINLFQWILIILGMYFAFNTISKINKIPNWLLILGPSLLGIVNNVTNAYGAGYNDIYGITIILFLIPFLYELQNQENVSLKEIVWAMMGIVCLALLKVFFALFSALIFVYLLWIVYEKKGFSFKKDQQFWLSILAIILSFGFIFIIPWAIRSYLQTGRILDPIGAPGINEDAYNFAGSGNAINHWTRFVWTRLAKNLVLIPTIRYTPLLGLAFLLPILKSFRTKQFLPIWLLGAVGFWLIYFFSIVTEWRYFLPGVYTLLLILVIFVSNKWTDFSQFISKKFKLSTIKIRVIIIVFCCALIPLSYVLTLKTTDLGKDMYVFENQSIDQYLQSRVGEWKFGYYPSPLSFKPAEIKKDETILVVSLQGMAYVDQPFISPWINIEDFRKIKDLKQLKAYLETKNIKFILTKNISFDQFCTQTIKQECTEKELNSMLKNEGRTEEQNVTWYSLR